MINIALAALNGNFKVAKSISEMNPDTSLRTISLHEIVHTEAADDDFSQKMEKMNDIVPLSQATGEAKGGTIEVYA